MENNSVAVNIYPPSSLALPFFDATKISRMKMNQAIKR